MKKERKKKIKIIREIPPEIKEVEKEKEPEEIEREELEQVPEEEFSEFATEAEFVSEPTTLPISITIPETKPEETLEQELRNVPSQTRGAGEAGERKSGRDYAATNIPQYTSNYEERVRYEEAEKERRFEIKDLSAPASQRREDVLELGRGEQELARMSEQEREMRRYQEERIIHEPEERRLPFDRRERKKERILK